MRTLSVNISTDIDKTVTAPTYLVYMGFISPLRYSTRGTINFDAQTWSPSGGVKVENLSEFGASVSVQNTDNGISQLVLGEKTTDVPVTIYEHRNGDAIERFSGFIAGVDSRNDRVSFDVANVRSDVAKIPNVRFSSPRFNFLPPRSGVFQWGNITINLTAPEADY